jgi:hypothetical protein
VNAFFGSLADENIVRLQLVLGLWIGIVTIEKKRYDLLENLFADIDCAMDTVARLNPIDLADCDLPRHRGSAIAKFDMQQVSAQNHSYAMKRVVMPRGGFAGREPLAAHEVISPMMEHLLI